MDAFQHGYNAIMGSEDLDELAAAADALAAVGRLDEVVQVQDVWSPPHPGARRTLTGSLLSTASWRSWFEGVALLLLKGANPRGGMFLESELTIQDFVLQTAASGPPLVGLRYMRALMDAAQFKDDVVDERSGATALIYAAKMGYRYGAELLLLMGADARAADKSGGVALEYAAQAAGARAVAGALIAAQEGRVPSRPPWPASALVRARVLKGAEARALLPWQPQR